MTASAPPATVSVFVPGRSAPQGSKQYVGHRGGKPVLTESSRRLGAWRDAVAWHVHAARRGRVLAAPVHIDVLFILPRPQALPVSRPTPAMTKIPDLDKLTRAVFDALTMSGLIADDARITRLSAAKRYAEPHEKPGAHITAQEGTD